MSAAEETQLSADGGWWWNGADWVPATSADGLWRWTGDRWQAAIEFDPDDPAAVVAALDRLVDDRFARGGQMLALRAHEWRPRTDELAGLVAQAAPLAARLSAIDAQLTGMDGHGIRPTIRGILGGGDREQLEGEGHRIDQELRPLLALIGRTAPQPSLKDADEILVPARRLHDAVLELQGAVTELQRLLAEHEQRVAVTRAEVDRAMAERDAALGDNEERVREREAEHRQAVADLSAALRQLRIPDPGPPRARFHGLVLLDNRVETPDGRGWLEGAQAIVGTAAELAAEHREALAELWMLGAENAVRVHDALAAGSDERYILVLTSRITSAVPVPRGAEPDAEAFIAAFAEAVQQDPKGRRQWEAQVKAAEAALEAALSDTSAVDDARAALEQARQDPELNAPVKTAERRLRDAERPTAPLAAAEERVRTLIARLLKEPEALRPAAAG